MKFLLLEEVDSTNGYVAMHSSELENLTMVIAESQTAGRGQRGNSWESAPGQNLTFTLYFEPEGIVAREQFSISEGVALACVDFLASEGIAAKVKWPNDIYVGDRKISGILIEHALLGAKISHSRIGVGLNVNQQAFRSDAPNPVSMWQVANQKYDITRVAAAFGMALTKRLAETASAEGREALHQEFISRLWRGDGGAYAFRRRDDGCEFEGIIENVSKIGPITIRDINSGESREYAFKEVEFLL